MKNGRTRKPFEYKEVAASEVRKYLELGWIPTKAVLMVPPEYLDDDLLAVAEAARAVA